MNNRLMEQDIQSRQRWLLECVDKWAKVKEGGIGGEKFIKLFNKNPEKAKLVAGLLENQKKYNRILKETGNSLAYLGLTPQQTLQIVRLGTVSAIDSDIFSKIALKSTDDKLYFLDTTFGKSLRGSTLGDKTFESYQPLYAGETYSATLGTGNGANETFTATLSPNPIVPFKVVIKTDKKTIGNDNGAQVISGTGISAGTIDYTTGIISVTFTNAPATGVVVSVEYNFNSELDAMYPTYYGTVSLGIRPFRFLPRPEPLGYEISDMTELTLSTTGIDADPKSTLMKGIIDEHARAQVRKAIAMAKSYALGNNILEFDTDYAQDGSVSDTDYCQRVWTTIKYAIDEVYNVKKRGGIAKIVAGANAETYLEKHDKFVANNVVNYNGEYLAGTLNGIEVYKTPADTTFGGLANNEILVTVKGQEGMDTGLVIGSLTSISADLRYPNFITKGNVAEVVSRQMITPEFNRLIRLSNLDQNLVPTV